MRDTAIVTTVMSGRGNAGRHGRMTGRRNGTRVAVPISVLFSFFFAGLTAYAQGTALEPSALPPPTGTFKVGRVTAHWTDTSRVESLAADRRYRELMVDVWYPADPMTGPAAAYLDSSVFEQPQTAERLKGYLR